jgi:membrane protein DedA with SNARE-associated domain
VGITESLAVYAINLINELGYGGLAFGLIIDSAGIPIPSEVLVPAAAILAKEGRFNLPLMMTVATLAQTLGAVIAYYIGLRGGLPFIRKYGKYVLISNRELNLTHRWFERYGEGLTFVGRCMPIVRGYIGFVGGIAEMPFKRFLAASFLGSLTWTIILTVLGYMVADNVHKIEEMVRPFSIIIALGLAFGLVYFIIHRIRSNKGHK